jgi:ubiquinone biosynthesis protein
MRFARAVGRVAVRVCERLGASFIKLGQIASTRADLLPSAVVVELSRLQDRVRPVAFEHVRETIEQSLGCPLEQAFAEFDAEPVASASVAQVHRARLASGEIVAVKVRRPEVPWQVALDRRLLIGAARVLERGVPSLRLISLVEAVTQFCDAVEQQLDLTREAAHNRRFRAHFADDPEVAFPLLFPALCSDQVLTMEYVEAIHERDLAAHGIEPARIAEAGLRAVCRMIFRDGFVHADLHPGNLRFAPPGRIVLLDLGLVGELAHEDRVTTAELLIAFATGDGAAVARSFYDHAPSAAPADYAAYEAEVCAFVSEVVGRGLGRVQISLEIGRIFDILRRHRIQARAHMTMANLALMTAEGLGKRLAPDLSLADAALPYLREALRAAADRCATTQSSTASGPSVPPSHTSICDSRVSAG